MKLRNIIFEIKVNNPKYDVIRDSVGNVFYFKKDTNVLHRVGGPAIEYWNGMKEWFMNGILHREGGPAIEYSDGSQHWFQNGETHRLDGPAYEGSNGSKEWYQNGKRHRLDGPAVEWANGDKEWFQNGEHHRLDGPAIELNDGEKWWFIDGKRYTKKDFNKISKNLNEIKINNPKNSFRITPKGKDLISKVQILDDLLSEFGVDIYEDISIEKLSFILSINAMVKDRIISLDGFNNISIFYEDDGYSDIDYDSIEKDILKMKKYGIII